MIPERILTAVEKAIANLKAHDPAFEESLAFARRKIRGSVLVADSTYPDPDRRAAYIRAIGNFEFLLDSMERVGHWRSPHQSALDGALREAERLDKETRSDQGTK